ncbi:hypothetical protein [Bradyrhizobium sp. JR3.5]
MTTAKSAVARQAPRYFCTVTGLVGILARVLLKGAAGRDQIVLPFDAFAVFDRLATICRAPLLRFLISACA